MKFIYPISFLIIFILGAYFGVNSFSRSKDIILGREKRIGRIIADAAMRGLSITFLFFGGVYFLASITERSYQFQIKNLVTGFALFLVPGLVVFVGSVWQYFQVGIFRGALVKYFNKRENNENGK